MRLPNRKPGKYTFPTFDHVMTAEKLQELKDTLARLKNTQRPRAIADTKRFAENGDFSENAEYQIAKGRLRGINKKIDELEFQIARAQVIAAPQDTSIVRVGHTVKVHMNNREQSFTILGSEETNPSKGLISYSSPLGQALLGHAIDETVELRVGSTHTRITILSITQ